MHRPKVLLQVNTGGQLDGLLGARVAGGRYFVAGWCDLQTAADGVDGLVQMLYGDGPKRRHGHIVDVLKRRPWAPVKQLCQTRRTGRCGLQQSAGQTQKTGTPPHVQGPGSLASWPPVFATSYKVALSFSEWT